MTLAVNNNFSSQVRPDQSLLSNAPAPSTLVRIKNIFTKPRQSQQVDPNRSTLGSRIKKIFTKPRPNATFSQGVVSNLPSEEERFIRTAFYHLLDSISPEEQQVVVPIQDTRLAARAVEVEPYFQQPNATFSQGVVSNLPNKEERLIQIDFSYLLHDISPEEKQKLIAEVKKIPIGERKSFFSELHFIFKLNSDLLERKAEIFRIFFTCTPAEERASLIHYVIHRFTPNLSVEEQLRRIRTIASTPSEQRELVMEYAYSLFHRTNGDSKMNSIIATIELIKPEQRKSVTENTFPFVTRYMSGEEVGRLLSAVSEIPARSRESVAQYASLVFTPYMNIDDIIGIMSKIQKIPEEQRASVFSIFPPNADKDKIGVWLIELVSCMPAQEIESLLNVFPIFTPIVKKNEFKRQEFIDYLHTIPIQERGSVLRWTSCICHQGMYQDILIKIMEIMRQIPNSQRKNFARYVHHLCCHRQYMTYRDQLWVMEYVKNIPDSQRIPFMQSVYQLTAPRKNCEAPFGPDDDTIATPRKELISTPRKELVSRPFVSWNIRQICQQAIEMSSSTRLEPRP